MLFTSLKGLVPVIFNTCKYNKCQSRRKHTIAKHEMQLTRCARCPEILHYFPPRCAIFYSKKSWVHSCHTLQSGMSSSSSRGKRCKHNLMLIRLLTAKLQTCTDFLQLVCFRLYVYVL